MRDAMGMACFHHHAFMGTNSWSSTLLNLERNSRPFPCVPAAACPRLSAPRRARASPGDRRLPVGQPVHLDLRALAPAPDPDGGARHRASGASVDAAVFSTAVPLSSPTRRVRVRRSRLPRTDADSAARARARAPQASASRRPGRRLPGCVGGVRATRDSLHSRFTHNNNLGDDGCETRSTHGHQSQERATANAPAFVL